MMRAEHVIAIGRSSMISDLAATAHIFVADDFRVRLVALVHTERDFMNTLMTLLARDAGPLQADQTGGKK
jgi:hypothetical protein